jgi:hypothetical protein
LDLENAYFVSKAKSFGGRMLCLDFSHAEPVEVSLEYSSTYYLDDDMKLNLVKKHKKGADWDYRSKMSWFENEFKDG